MNADLPPASQTSDAPSDDGARPLYERQIAMLSEIAEEGLKLIKTLGRQVEAAQEEGAQITPAVGITYAKLARAVRLTHMLQDRLIRTLQDRGRHLAWLADSDTSRAEQKRKARVKHIVERIAANECDTWPDVERLVGEASERLDQDDLYGCVLDRPVSELIAMICKDIGLDPDWSMLAEEAWARQEITGGLAGWPFKPGADPNPPPLGEGDREAVEGAFELRPGASGKAPSPNRCAAGPPSPIGKDFPEAPPPLGEGDREAVEGAFPGPPGGRSKAPSTNRCAVGPPSRIGMDFPEDPPPSGEGDHVQHGGGGRPETGTLWR